MFGFSFGELVVLVVVAIVVIGPKDLPKVLRTLGQWAGKLRRMASELRAQSGIDDVLRTEGLTEDLNEIRKLARGELDTISRAARVDGTSTAGAVPSLAAYENDALNTIEREREQPKDGPDTGNSMPDTAFVYAEGFPKSKWATDPVWVLGDPNGVIPAPPPKPEPAAEPDHDHDHDKDPAPSPAPADAAAAPAPEPPVAQDKPAEPPSPPEPP